MPSLVCTAIVLSSLLGRLVDGAPGATPSSAPVPFTDPLTGITFLNTVFTDADSKSSFAFGLALPTTPGTDFIGRLETTVASLGWTSIDLAEDMKKKLMIAAYPDKSALGGINLSGRYSLTYKSSPVYTTNKITLTPILKGMLVNDSHITATFVCGNCINADSFTATADSATFAYGYSNRAVKAGGADLNDHTNLPYGSLAAFTLKSAQSPNFAQWVTMAGASGGTAAAAPAAPAAAAPAASVPASTVPAAAAPVAAVPAAAVPAASVPAAAAPAAAVPASTVPAAAAPAAVIPAASVPASAAPVAAVPATSVPAASAPAAAVPAASVPAAAAPVAAVPASSVPSSAGTAGTSMTGAVGGATGTIATGTTTTTTGTGTAAGTTGAGTTTGAVPGAAGLTSSGAAGTIAGTTGGSTTGTATTAAGAVPAAAGATSPSPDTTTTTPDDPPPYGPITLLGPAGVTSLLLTVMVYVTQAVM